MFPYADHDLGSTGVGFAMLLRGRRLAAGLTQQELAHRSGLGVRTVRELERGRVARPQRGTVSLLADALELTGQERDEFVAASINRKARVDRAVRGTAPLPVPPELIGRDREIAGLAELLETADMVTLVGVAGVGKTCLALAVAHRYARHPTAAAISVRVAAGVDDILAAAASVFGVHRAAELVDREGLLLVDGVDRAPAAATEAIRWLRAHVPGLKILATGLSSVGVPSSVDGVVSDGLEWRVEPLDVPPEDASLELDQLRRYPSVELFLARLRQVRREPVREAEAPALAELVRRLCGLPLAIELAAARGGILDLPKLLERYGSRMLDLGPGEHD
jgi:transcriptional regulator with XRE-family HTH domain